MERPTVVLTGFLDEAAGASPSDSKPFDMQVALAAAYGLRWMDLRFVDLGGGTKNVMALDGTEIFAAQTCLTQYDVRVSSLGSPLAKVKLVDVEDGTKNRYVPFETYLATDVARAYRLAELFGTRLVRIFSFYHPKGQDKAQFWSQTIDQLGRMAKAAEGEDILLCLEVEANLMGSDGASVARICAEVNSPNLCGLFDGANCLVQNLSTAATQADFAAMLPSHGPIMHIKDYAIPPGAVWQGHVDEAGLRNFVPVELGDAGHAHIFEALVPALDGIVQRYSAFDIPGMFLSLEPHVKGGGQFGGYSGPDGFSAALESLCRMLSKAGICCERRAWGDVAAWKKAMEPKQ
jgi:hypothetical protein